MCVSLLCAQASSEQSDNRKRRGEMGGVQVRAPGLVGGLTGLESGACDREPTITSMATPDDRLDVKRNAMTTQSLGRSREPVLVVRRVSASGPITALATASPQRKVNVFGRHTSGPDGEGKEGPHGRNGSVNPPALRQRTTITKPSRGDGGDRGGGGGVCQGEGGM